MLLVWLSLMPGSLWHHLRLPPRAVSCPVSRRNLWWTRPWRSSRRQSHSSRWPLMEPWRTSSCLSPMETSLRRRFEWNHSELKLVDGLTAFVLSLRMWWSSRGHLLARLWSCSGSHWRGSSRKRRNCQLAEKEKKKKRKKTLTTSTNSLFSSSFTFRKASTRTWLALRTFLSQLFSHFVESDFKGKKNVRRKARIFSSFFINHLIIHFSENQRDFLEKSNSLILIFFFFFYDIFLIFYLNFNSIFNSEYPPTLKLTHWAAASLWPLCTGLPGRLGWRLNTMTTSRRWLPFQQLKSFGACTVIVKDRMIYPQSRNTISSGIISSLFGR